ncbi:hypothetical protein Ancab_004278 [Ancistrocladus abbreviatus]
MENLRRGKIASGEMLSSPGTPTDSQNDEFEFGCITPSPPLDDSNKDSPADQFFMNGKLLPHSFPKRGGYGSDNSRMTSRTSSTGSKDSLMWSRSNSTNSRSSNCSSARTSSSEVSERRMLQNRIAGQHRRSALGQKCEDQFYKYQHGSSQRWQFIAAAPVLDPSLSRRRRSSSTEFMQGKLSPRKEGSDHDHEKRCGWQRILRSVVKTCKACHAMETAVVDDDFNGNLEL